MASASALYFSVALGMSSFDDEALYQNRAALLAQIRSRTNMHTLYKDVSEKRTLMEGDLGGRYIWEVIHYNDPSVYTGQIYKDYEPYKDLDIVESKAIFKYFIKKKKPVESQ